MKLSFVFFYRRIFPRKVAKIFNVVSLTMIGIILVWTIAFFFSILFICGTDFSAYWTSTIVEKEHCVNTNMLHNAFAISDVITDIMIITLPIPMVSAPHLSKCRLPNESHRSGIYILRQGENLESRPFSALELCKCSR